MPRLRWWDMVNRHEASVQDVIDFGAALHHYLRCPSCGADELDVQLLDGDQARCRICKHEHIKPRRLPYRSGWRQAYPQLVPKVEDEEADRMEALDERGWRE